MSKELRIIGLGRCVIGLLRKNIGTIEGIPSANDAQITFDHHYILNPETCLKTACSKKDLAPLLGAECMPSLPDQLQCLDDIKDYNICAIELFPPSQLYKHRSLNIFACFESFTKQLSNLGFENFSTSTENRYFHHRDVEHYISNIEQLINKIKVLNNSIKIVLINGELSSCNNGIKVGSEYIRELMDKINNAQFLRQNYIQLLDINDLIISLAANRKSSYETAFPYLYIRHAPDLSPIGLARDCKHTTPIIRTYFAEYFCDKLEKWGFHLPLPQVQDETCPNQDDNFSERANRYIAEQINHCQTLTLNDNAKKISLFVTYTLETKNQTAHDLLQKYVEAFSIKFPTCGADLKNYFYHLRTITAYTFESQRPFLASLSLIGIRVLNLPQAEIEQYSNFVLLWIKNIFLACSRLLSIENRNFSFQFSIFHQKLTESKYLINHDVIEKILAHQTAPLNEATKFSGLTPLIKKKLSRLAVFLPRSTPFYISNYYAIKHAFESHGIEVTGWTELLGEEALLEFCRRYKPQAILEMNRSRHELPNLNKDIIHICWMVDYMGHNLDFFNGSEIIYFIGAFWGQHYSTETSSHIDWLPPGFNPQIYKYSKQAKISDFSFVGHIPLPWNDHEKKRELFQGTPKQLTFENFWNIYEARWESSKKQPTPLEVVQELSGDEQYQDSQILEDQNLTMKYDVLCRSRRIMVRKKLILEALRLSKSLRIYGSDNWKKWPAFADFHHGFINDPELLSNIYQTSQLNLHEGLALHMRLFDCFGSGGCMLYVNPDQRNTTGAGMNFFFEKDVHYLGVDMDDFEYQVKYYLNNPARCMKIGKEASKIVHADHKWSDRAKKIVCDIEKLL